MSFLIKNEMSRRKKKLAKSGLLQWMQAEKVSREEKTLKGWEPYLIPQFCRKKKNPEEDWRGLNGPCCSWHTHTSAL